MSVGLSIDFFNVVKILISLVIIFAVAWLLGLLGSLGSGGGTITGIKILCSVLYRRSVRKTCLAPTRVRGGSLSWLMRGRGGIGAALTISWGLSSVTVCDGLLVGRLAVSRLLSVGGLLTIGASALAIGGLLRLVGRGSGSGTMTILISSSV